MNCPCGNHCHTQYMDDGCNIGNAEPGSLNEALIMFIDEVFLYMSGHINTHGRRH